MANENGKAQVALMLAQISRGVSNFCKRQPSCDGCMFNGNGVCDFGTPSPKTWSFDSDVPGAKVQETKKVEKAVKPTKAKEVEKAADKTVKSEVVKPKEDKPKAETNILANNVTPEEAEQIMGTWVVHKISSSGFITRYLYKCSKCGYEKESVLSLVGPCPNCEQQKMAFMVGAEKKMKEGVISAKQ